MQNFRWQQSCLVTAPRPLFPCKRPHRADARSLYPGRGQPVLPACIWRKNRLSRCNPAGSGSDRRSVPLRSCNVRRSGILRLRSIRFLQAVFCSGRCRGQAVRRRVCGLNMSFRGCAATGPEAARKKLPANAIR